MRASPAVQVTFRRFGVWRAGVASIAWLGLGALAAWLMAWPWPLSALRMTAAALAAASLAWAALSLVRVPAVNLRWDGRVWFLLRLDPRFPEPIAGELRVMVDLGPWMLLRFVPVDRREGMAAVWLPAQRRGSELQWHGFRCAVHAAGSPRPARQPAAVE